MPRGQELGPRMSSDKDFRGTIDQDRSGTQARILVVDDHPVNVMALSMLLKASGFDVRGTSEGRAALEIAAEFRPSVVLLDIGIPVMDGYEIARRLRADPAFASLRIIAVTGYGSDEARQKSREAGFDRHLVKPVPLEELLAAIAHSG
jgi:two-component system, sensor histidine kinase